VVKIDFFFVINEVLILNDLLNSDYFERNLKLNVMKFHLLEIALFLTFTSS
ncbi:unnamed protein product, partial [Larinioides sclopetarius]